MESDFSLLPSLNMAHDALTPGREKHGLVHCSLPSHAGGGRLLCHLASCFVLQGWFGASFIIPLLPPSQEPRPSMPHKRCQLEKGEEVSSGDGACFPDSSLYFTEMMEFVCQIPGGLCSFGPGLCSTYTGPTEGGSSFCPSAEEGTGCNFMIQRTSSYLARINESTKPSFLYSPAPGITELIR